MSRMSDNPSDPVPPEVPSSSESSETTTSPLTVFGAATPLPIRAEMLTEGLRYLEQRIPGYVHLSVDEQRALIRAAFLDPEFLEGGIEAALNWSLAKDVLGSSGEELRDANDLIASWDETIRKFRIVLEGMEGANLQRRHELGHKILLLYAILKTTVKYPDRRHLRPYLENMKRAYLKRRKKPAKGEETS